MAPRRGGAGILALRQIRGTCRRLPHQRL